jgi:hypothetical protein
MPRKTIMKKERINAAEALKNGNAKPMQKYKQLLAEVRCTASEQLRNGNAKYMNKLKSTK